MTFHHRSYRKRAGLGAVAATVAVGLMVLVTTGPANAAEPPVDLGTAADFSVLAGTTVTNTGPTTVADDLGVSPGSAVTGFPPGTVDGDIETANGVATTAQTNLTAAYNDAAGRTPFTVLQPQLGGTTVIPGVYQFTSGAQVTGTLTLDSQNDPTAVFIFQIASTLVTASNSDVVFINGASPCNVYWQVGSSATLGTNSDFIGNIMALTSITITTGVDLNGRALARNGAVTLDDNDITTPVCAAATSPPASPSASNPAGSPSQPPATGPPGDSTTPGGPPRLPLTGPGLVPGLSATGIVLVALGIGLIVRFRRGKYGSP